MRVTSSSSPLPVAGDPPAASDAPAHEPFRTALRKAGTTERDHDRSDDTTVTAATQAAYLARAAGLPVHPSDAGLPGVERDATDRLARAGGCGDAGDATTSLLNAMLGAQQVDSPIAAWRAAAVARAIGAFAAMHQTGAGAASGAIGAPDTAADASAEVAPASTAVSRPGLAAAALTPLEQAVHDLVDRVVERIVARPGRADRADQASRPGAPADLVPLTGPSAPLAPARDAAPSTGAPATAFTPPEPPANPSHVHLVLDDGPERVVATVAVRGSEVHVALRATDEATAAAEPRERRPRDAPRFELEEKS
ncbi:MAG: hypothetical protein E6J90_32715 [Deltaproteobacteria bacterium]|nr:MAG: hypothetical protein E6J90_32715 [Deltaproteobacteria bacterium]